MADSNKTWISILVAAVIVVFILAVTMAGGTALFFYRHISTQPASSDSAAGEFRRARQRFTAQQPLIEFKDQEPVLHRKEWSGEPARRLTTLYVLAYDGKAGKLVRVNVPFWLLRMAPSGNVRFLDDNVDFNSERSHLTIEDLERHGPGLVLDQRDRRGAQVLVWTE